MGRLLATGLLILAATGAAGAQTPSSPAFVAGRQQLASGDYLEAADTFHRALREEGLGRYTLRVAVFCDLSNLERQLREAGDAAELLVLRRSVGDRPCMALYWGLFPSRAEAQAAVGTIPAPLRAAGQSAVPVGEILPAAEAPPAPVAVAPPAPARVPPVAPPPAAPAPLAPAPVAPTRPAPEPLPPAAVPPPPVIEPPPPTVPPASPTEAPPVPSPAEPDRVPALEIEAGYSILWDDGLSPDDGNAFFDLGWVLSGTANLNRRLGVVGEVSGHYDWGETLDVAGVPLDLDLGILGVHAGLRYSHRGAGPVVPYVKAACGSSRAPSRSSPGPASSSGSRRAWGSGWAATTGWSWARTRAATSSGSTPASSSW